MQGCAMLEQNFGIGYGREKMSMLLSMMKEDGWTEDRFKRTLRWFLKNKFNPAWTVSDWFNHEVKVYSYSWYLKQVHEKGVEVNDELEVVYLPEGKIGYRYMGEEPLPFDTKPISEIH